MVQLFDDYLKKYTFVLSRLKKNVYRASAKWMFFAMQKDT